MCTDLPKGDKNVLAAAAAPPLASCRKIEGTHYYWHTACALESLQSGFGSVRIDFLPGCKGALRLVRRLADRLSESHSGPCDARTVGSLGCMHVLCRDGEGNAAGLKHSHAGSQSIQSV